MPDEKANNPFHWKSQLEQLADIPGEAPFDQAAAWQKLYGRLQKEPLSRKTNRYRIAAACLLCIMVLSWLVWVQPGTPLVKDSEPRPGTLPKSFPDLPSRDAAAVSVQQAVKKKSASPLSTKNKVHPPLVNIAATSRPVLPDPDIIKEVFPPIVIHQPVVDTIRLIAAAPKKKLKVVHVNELNNTAEDMQLASNATASSIKELLRADERSGFSTGRNASDNIIKIKLSSSN